MLSEERTKIETQLQGAYAERAELQRLLERCQVIFASHYVYDRIVSLVDSDRRVIEVKLTIDQGNIDLIRERLTLTQPSGARGEVAIQKG